MTQTVPTLIADLRSDTVTRPTAAMREAMMAAPADGQTIMVTASNILTEIPHVMKTAFDPLKDVKPVVAVARSGLVFIADPNFPASDVKGAGVG